MERIRARRQHRHELLAGGRLDVTQEPLFLRHTAPAVAHRDGAPVGERERGDIERVAKGMFGNMRARLAIHAAAGIGRNLFDLDDRASEPTLRRGLDRIRYPTIERRNDRTGERRGRCHGRDGCGSHGSAGWSERHRRARCGGRALRPAIAIRIIERCDCGCRAARVDGLIGRRVGRRRASRRIGRRWLIGWRALIVWRGLVARGLRHQARRTDLIGVAKRRPLTEHCDLERKVRPADSGSLNRAQQRDARPLSDRARFEACLFGFAPPWLALRKPRAATAREHKQQDGAAEIAINRAHGPTMRGALLTALQY